MLMKYVRINSNNQSWLAVVAPVDAAKLLRLANTTQKAYAELVPGNQARAIINNAKREAWRHGVDISDLGVIGFSKARTILLGC